MKVQHFWGELTDISAKEMTGSDTQGRNTSLLHPTNTCSVCTAGPLIIESLKAEKRVSAGGPGALDDPLVVQTKT